MEGYARRQRRLQRGCLWIGGLVSVQQRQGMVDAGLTRSVGRWGGSFGEGGDVACGRGGGRGAGSSGSSSGCRGGRSVLVRSLGDTLRARRMSAFPSACACAPRRPTLTFIKYSTARSGLLKLALIARMTISLGNPMLTISFTLVSNAEPMRNDPPLPLLCEGVSASALLVSVDAGAGAGALGATGGVDAWAGVEGMAAEGVGAAAEAAGFGAGAGLGLVIITTQNC